MLKLDDYGYTQVVIPNNDNYVFAEGAITDVIWRSEHGILWTFAGARDRLI